MDEVNGRVELILKRQRLSGPCNGSSGQRHAELLASLCNIIEVQALQIAQLRGEAPADLDLPKHLPEESGAAPEVQAPATSADPEQSPTRPPDEAACPPPAMPTGLKALSAAALASDKQQEQEASAEGRACLSCGITETPKWRRGMTLCNACGLREGKKKAQGLGENQRLPTEAAAGPSTPLQGPVLPAVAPNTSLASAEYAFARPADFSCQSPPLAIAAGIVVEPGVQVATPLATPLATGIMYPMPLFSAPPPIMHPHGS